MSSSRSIRILIPLLLLLVAHPAAAQRWVSVDVGLTHTCALDSRGRAFCWGSNKQGELGVRTPQECGYGRHGEGEFCFPSGSREPVAVGGGMRFRAISAGTNVSCGLDGRGRAWCWGGGVGAVREGCEGDFVCTFHPRPFAPEMRFRSLRAGEDGVCGITRAGAGHCWRRARDAGEWPMTPVAPGERLVWVDQHSDWLYPEIQIICAATVDGRAFCHGDNRMAQLGAGDTVRRTGAARVASAARFVRVQAWRSSGCGLTATGAAECWGEAESPPYRSGAPSDPSWFACGPSTWCSGPRPVAPGLRFAALAYDYDRFCGVDAAGQVQCWGMDGVPSPMAEGVRFTTLEGGRTHTCGVAHDGAIWCWERTTSARPIEVVRAPDPPR